MKKFAFLLLSLALAFGCQPADEGGSGSGDDTSTEETTTDGDDTDAGDSAVINEEDATKMVSLEITSKLA